MHLVAAEASVVPRDRLIRLSEVERLSGLRRSAIYAGMKAGSFPKCVMLTGRSVAWPESRVLSWVQARIAAADTAGQQLRLGNGESTDA